MPHNNDHIVVPPPPKDRRKICGVGIYAPVLEGNRITAISPDSDLFGKVKIGDRVISAQEDRDSQRQSINGGNPTHGLGGTRVWVNVAGYDKPFLAMRKPFLFNETENGKYEITLDGAGWDGCFWYMSKLNDAPEMDNANLGDLTPSKASFPQPKPERFRTD